MTISELIKQLESIKEDCGDLNVYVRGGYLNTCSAYNAELEDNEEEDIKKGKTTKRVTIE